MMKNLFIGHTNQSTWRRPEIMLLALSVALPLSFATWQALLNNFVIERAAFTGIEIGILQSLREVPGFLAFSAVFVLLFLREQSFILIALVLLGVGTALTGQFESEMGLYLTTILMSVGFHYFETLRQSLALQWIDKERAPIVLGRMVSVGSFAGMATFVMIWLMLDVLGVDMSWVYVLGGGLTLAIAVFCWLAFPRFPEKVEQHKKIILRRRYGLYYALTFMWGARRQIFVVFAGFLMVEKFGFTAAEMSLIFLLTSAMVVWISPKVGRAVARFGERRILVLEYTGLIGVFVAYAYVDTAWLAVLLYLLDHLFFAMSFAMKTYLQKIADPADIAATSGVSFTINHIAAVAVPVVFGAIWIESSAWVFLIGAGMAAVSLLLSLFIPTDPSPENVVRFSRAARVAAQ